MYAKFFGLQQEPFSIAPDPRYLFMSERHRDALAHLLYGVRGGGGFVLLTGEIGAGKTTVCRCFLEQIPEACNVAYIFNPKLTVMELLKTVCDEFHIAHDSDASTVKQYIDPLNAFLLASHAQGRNNVLIIDEAQNLSAEVLEQLRLLTNLETNERKLLQIILIGQPELRGMVAAPELEQLAQRVIARFHLQALSETETAQYVRHRLAVAGFDGAIPFDKAALRRIHEFSGGVPRRINLLCDRALLGAYSQGRKRVDLETLKQAAGEVFGSVLPSVRQRRLIWALGVAGLFAAAAVFALATRKPISKPLAMLPVHAAASAASATSAAAPVESIAQGFASERDAWKALAKTWHLELAEGDDPCQALKEQGLAQCFQSDGGLALVRLLERPSILTLRHAAGHEAGKPFYALLLGFSGLNGQYASVRVGTLTQTLSLQALSKQWRGEFATLWRLPPGYVPKLAPGDEARWLAAQLAKASGETLEPGEYKFDAALQAKVATFQRAQGLKSDGRAGPITLMQLNRAAGVDEPRLQLGPTLLGITFMSYILDALRRAESERERGSVPTLHTHAAPVDLGDDEAGPAPSRLWIWASGVAALLLLGAVGSHWLVGEGGEQVRPVPPPMSAPLAPPPQPLPIVQAKSETQRAAPLPAPAVAAMPSSVAAVPASAEAEHAVPAFNELPESVRKSLPPVVSGGAMYSDTPANRMLILNGQVFHEGETVAPDLVLEQIKLRGAVLVFKGQRFSISF